MATMEDLIATISGSHVGQDGYDLQTLQAHLTKTLQYAHYPSQQLQQQTRLPLTPSQTYHEPPTTARDPFSAPSHRKFDYAGMSTAYRPVQGGSTLPVAPVSSLTGVTGTGMEMGDEGYGASGSGSGHTQGYVDDEGRWIQGGQGWDVGQPVAGPSNIPGGYGQGSSNGYGARPQCTPASSYRGFAPGIQPNRMDGGDSSEGEGMEDVDEDMTMDDGMDDTGTGMTSGLVKPVPVPVPGLGNSSFRSASSMETDYGAFEADAFAPLQDANGIGGIASNPYGAGTYGGMIADGAAGGSATGIGMDEDASTVAATMTKSPWDAFRKSSNGSAASGNNVWGGQTPTWGSSGSQGGVTPHGSAGAGLASKGLTMSMAMSPTRFTSGQAGGGGSPVAAREGSPFGGEAPVSPLSAPAGGLRGQQSSARMSKPPDETGTGWSGRLRSSRRNA